jgi:hypothetical protein
MWRSPGDGRVRITGRLTDRHQNCGDGFGWQIRQVGRHRGLAYGQVPNGGAVDLDPSSFPALVGRRVRADARIYLRIGPGRRGAGTISCDSTEISLRIEFRTRG